MPDYRNGLIYMLKSKDENIQKIYIGSTCNFSRRKNRHKTRCCNPNDKKYHYKVYQFIRQNSGWYEWEMVKIKNFPCNIKSELEAEERRVMLNDYGLDICLNKNQPSRTKKQYYEDNKDKILEKKKQYRIDNKDKIKEKKKQYRIDNKDRIKEKKKQYYEDNKDKILEKKKQYYEDNKDKIKHYYEDNKDKILEKKKQYRIDNKDKINEKKKEKFTCECGSKYTKCHKSRHLKTKKHLQYIQNN